MYILDLIEACTDNELRVQELCDHVTQESKQPRIELKYMLQKTIIKKLIE